MPDHRRKWYSRNMPADAALPSSIASAASLLALLEWQIAMGADAAIGAIAVDRLTPPAQLPQAVPAPPRPTASTPAPAIVAPPSAFAESLAEAAQSARLLAAASTTIETLGACVAGFDLCPLKRTATNTVLLDGN